jgi:hypothetical protein
MTDQQKDGRIPSFGDALRRLVGVPKSEIEAEEAKYQKMRKRLKDKKAKRKPEK